MRPEYVYYYVGSVKYSGVVVQFIDTKNGIRAVVRTPSGRYVEMELSEISHN